MIWLGPILAGTINKTHPRITLGILWFSSLLSPFWYLAIGLIWLCIQGAKKVVIFFRTVNWAI
jgi:hypothetical protein